MLEMGRDNKGRVVGLENPQKLLEAIPSKISMGHDVRSYNLERTVCDVLRSRNKWTGRLLLTR